MTVRKALGVYSKRYPELYYTMRGRKFPLFRLKKTTLVSHRGGGQFSVRDLRKDKQRTAGPAKDKVGGKRPYSHSGDIYPTKKGVPTSGYQDRYIPKKKKKKPVHVNKSKRAREHSRRKPVRRRKK